MQNQVSQLTAIFMAGALLLAASAAPAQVLSPVHNFGGDTNDANPVGVSLLLSGNTLYGTISGGATPGGGRSGSGPGGSIFKVNTDGIGFTNIYIFGAVNSRDSLTNSDGATPFGPLVLSGNILYGTTENGSSNGNGTVFAINTDGTGLTNLHVFGANSSSLTNADGYNPSAGLVLSGNTLYGVTASGGNFGDGTVFAIQTDGTGFTNVYNFSMVSGGTDTNSDGNGAKTRLVLSGSTLYGTAGTGGSSGYGTVFAVNTDGTGFKNLHNFSALVRMTTPPYVYTNSDGLRPEGGLVLLGNTLYGTTLEGGANTNNESTGGGTVFAVNTDGSNFATLHNFGGSDGAGLNTGLVLLGNTLYGTTAGGSFAGSGNGIVFGINDDGTGFTSVDSFTPIVYNSTTGGYTNAGGANPVANLVLSSNTLYGATKTGGANGGGIVFALNLAVAPPTVQFTASPTNGLTRVPVQFTSPAVDAASNAILSWNWNFGDGSNSVSTSQNPTHTYTNAATFLPTLTCINIYGETVMGSGPAIVTQPLPPIAFTATPIGGVPPPMAVRFSSPSVDGGSNMIFSWNWNFGDSSNVVSGGQNPTHTYTNSGTYYPTLVCSNYYGDRSVGTGPAIVVPNSVLLNGGFETGTFTNWTLGGGASYDRVTTGTATAHSGKYGGELGARPVDGAGFLSQTLSTTPGADYLISFWLDVSLALTTNDFQVSWNGDVLLDETNVGSTGWTNFQLMATATLTNSILKFGYLAGSLYSLDDVIVTLGGSSAPKQPQIASFSVSGPNLVLAGGGASPSQTIFVLMSTNLLQPISQWVPVATNAPDSSGNFNVTATNAVDPKASQRYYILELQ